ncbi:MEKHLA domain-containing protein [Altererythrobacter sp. CC-YST694]|uniref:MEKHLA domain-containing protein n=1 Tax=Altererythrobacter sp. CC-YST694 TaxID=2755038 RepID=UPI001D015098|nr:MEKHLA domain-containing protein [Altererythrobacter sp. CC-YST694]MCB5424023.1 MEKHLA domain-containing protein [Altererythrobacter sp. CC-YST694]
MIGKRDWEAERRLIESHAGQARLAWIAASYRQLTRKDLVPEGVAIEAALWNLDAVVVAHGTEADPIFFYANRAALSLFEFSAEEFIRLPSRLSARPLARDERARMLARVSEHGFIDDYAGVRTARSGTCFRIEQAVVWNLSDPNGTPGGQAASFDRWTPINQ